ncbi:hypothetical protein JCM16814_10610 [Desulfobaculum senezii]
MQYSATTNSFYSHCLHGDNIPNDAVNVTDEEYYALRNAQSRGKRIQPDVNGRPVAVDPPPPPEPTEAELATQARTERDRLMREVYDPAVMQLLRKRRVLLSASDDVAGIDARLAEWDAYADALEVVPDQPGFPNSIEWPEAPSDSVVSGVEGGGVSCESESEPATSEV